jgi:hypothetical protein
LRNGVSDGGGPDWVREAFAQARDEVASFLRTARDFTLHPSSFARQWVAGERRALNPLGFLATSFAIVAGSDALMMSLAQRQEEHGFWESVVGSLAPFGYYLFVGLVAHGVLRLFGSRRRLSDTCAMALYAGGGPATLAHLFFLVAILVRQYLLGEGRAGYWLTWVAATGSFSALWTTLGFAVGGLNRGTIKVWHIIVANLVTLAVTGLVFAVVDPPGEFGLHLVMGPARDDDWRWVFQLYD